MLDPSTFTPPGPGVWELEATHMVRPVARSTAAIFPPAAIAGFRIGMARYGMLLDYLEFAVVNGFVYVCPRPVGAPKNAKGPPPKLIIKALVKLHPEMRRRVRSAGEAFATKRWREDIARWDNEWRPAVERENRALQRVDLGTLSDDQLVDHLGRCFDAVSRGITLHHTLNGTAMLPLGDFLVHVKEWTGLAPHAVLPLFRGSSRVSQGATTELDALARAIGDQHALLEGNDARALIDALTSRQDAIGEAARAYVDAAGVRVATGYDFADLTFSEMPELLVENIRAAVFGKTSTTTDDVAKREAALRDKVPAQHRAEFDALLAEARFTYRIRDERTYWNDSWSAGITRRAILEVGQRLTGRALLHDPEHAVELTPNEMVAMLRGNVQRTADQAAADVLYRTSHTIHDAPRYLGGTPSGPPPPEWLPPAAARAERAVGIVMGEMFVSREDKQQTATKVTGFAASPGQVTATARLVLDPREMARVKKGDVLITRATAPSYNALLPLLSGIVTDRGGTLSHAAVVAREYGIPAVVGCGNATELIRDGARVRVDGSSGTVEVLA
jgi:pyruvate,water dikinase